MEVTERTTGAYIQRKANAKTDYETPKDLFDELWKTWGGFDLDPCCLPEHYTARRIAGITGGIFTPENSGLDKPWYGKVYMNPPYSSKEIERWVSKAVHEVDYGGTDLVVALLPVRTGRPYWQDYVMSSTSHVIANHVEFLRGRLTFEGEKGCAPFNSAVVCWWKRGYASTG